MSAPSAWALEKAMAIAMATVDQLEREAVDCDEDDLRRVITDQGADIEGLMVRLLRTADEAGADIATIDARQEDLDQRKARFVARRTACRNAVQAMIEALPTVFPGGKYQCAEFTVSIRPGQPRPIITDEALLPADCWRISRAPDMAAIRERAKAGPVAGVEQSNGQPILTIKGR